MKRIGTMLITIASPFIATFAYCYIVFGGINPQYDLTRAINHFKIEKVYEYSPTELELIENAKNSGVFIDDGSFNDRMLYETYLSYYEMPENVRNAFEKGGGKIYLVDKIKSVSKEKTYHQKTNGSFTIESNGSYKIKLSADCNRYRKIRSVLRHEMGHYVNWHLGRVAENSDFWTNECNKKFFGDFMNINVNDNRESESFSETGALSGIKKMIFDYMFPEASAFVQEQWNNVK